MFIARVDSQPTAQLRGAELNLRVVREDYFRSS